MKQVSRVAEKKVGRNWIETYRTTEPAEVYKSLAKDMVNKKLCECRYITRIRRRSNYDGTETITVNYDNNIRSVYVIES